MPGISRWKSWNSTTKRCNVSQNAMLSDANISLCADCIGMGGREWRCCPGENGMYAYLASGLAHNISWPTERAKFRSPQRWRNAGPRFDWEAASKGSRLLGVFSFLVWRGSADKVMGLRISRVHHGQGFKNVAIFKQEPTRPYFPKAMSVKSPNLR